MLSDVEVEMDETPEPADRAGLIPLCDAADVPAGEAFRVELRDGRAIAVYNLNNVFYATDDLCSHGEASLAEGILEDDFQILCPFHMGGFDIRTGEVTAAPCHIAIRAYKVIETGGMLYIGADELNAPTGQTRSGCN